MFKVGVFAFLIGMANSIIVSDSGFNCATVKNNITTPLASALAPLGCSPKTDWNGGTSTWCLTNGSTGTYQSGFGYTDTCAQATIIPYFSSGVKTFYTGQVLNLSFSEKNIIAPETLVVSYNGRTLGSTSVTSRFFQTTLAGNAQLITNGSLSITTTNPFIQANITGFSIQTSRVVSVWLFTSAGPIISGTTIPCGQNFTIVWNSVGMASVGTASVSIATSGGGGGGGGGTIGTPITGIAVVPSGNNTITYLCPLSYTTPGFGNSYAATITVGTYTLRSFTFSLAAAPSASPTATSTPSQTPSPSLSFGSSPSNTGTPTPSLPSSPSRSLTSSITPSGTPTPSVTPTISFSGSPSVTSSITPTPSSTPTPRTIIDGSSILAAQSTQNTVMAASIAGGILALILSAFVAYRLYERNQLHERRMRRLRAGANTNVQTQRSIYIQSDVNPVSHMTMYQVQAPGRGRRAQR